MVAQVKGERNHPSVMIWSIENEWLYINCINLYGGLMDQFEAEVHEGLRRGAWRPIPTRPTMTDGGGANKDNACPCTATTTSSTRPTRSIPTWPTRPTRRAAGAAAGTWDQKRPRFIGEDFFVTGINPDYAYFGGEEAFQRQGPAPPRRGLMVRMLTEGYRWADYGAWHFWMGQNDADGASTTPTPRVAVFCRQWDWTFGSGQKVQRTLRHLQRHAASTTRSTFTWT